MNLGFDGVGIDDGATVHSADDATDARGAIVRDFDFGNGPSRCVNVTWGDVTSAYFSTGIPNIDVYFEAAPMLRGALLASRFMSPLASIGPWQVWLKMHAALLPEGPSQAERDAARVTIVAEVGDAEGRCARSRLCTAQSYSFTAVAAGSPTSHPSNAARARCSPTASPTRGSACAVIAARARSARGGVGSAIMRERA